MLCACTILSRFGWGCCHSASGRLQHMHKDDPIYVAQQQRYSMHFYKEIFVLQHSNVLCAAFFNQQILADDKGHSFKARQQCCV